MYGNKHRGQKKMGSITIWFSYMKEYEIIWKRLINLKMDITNLRVNTSIPSAKKRCKKSKAEVKMKYQKYSMHQK